MIKCKQMQKGCPVSELYAGDWAVQPPCRCRRQLPWLRCAKYTAAHTQLHPCFLPIQSQYAMKLPQAHPFILSIAALCLSINRFPNKMFCICSAESHRKRIKPGSAIACSPYHTTQRVEMRGMGTVVVPCIEPSAGTPSW
jgi:hypothetical protein